MLIDSETSWSKSVAADGLELLTVYFCLGVFRLLSWLG